MDFLQFPGNEKAERTKLMKPEAAFVILLLILLLTFCLVFPVFPFSGNPSPLIMILQIAAAFLTLMGMYKLGKLLSSEITGWFSAFALLLSPIFLLQTAAHGTESIATAAVVWSLYFCAGKKYVIASLLAVSALAVIVFSINRFFPLFVHNPAIAQTGASLLALKFRLFGAYLISSDYRWLPLTVALAGMIRGTGRDKERRLLPFVLILLFPSLFSTEGIAFQLFTAFVLMVYTVRERLVVGKLFRVFIVLPLCFVLVNALAVPLSQGSSPDLYRYIIPAYPVIVLGSTVMLFKYYARKTAIVICLISILFSFSTLRSQQYNAVDITLPQSEFCSDNVE